MLGVLNTLLVAVLVAVDAQLQFPAFVESESSKCIAGGSNERALTFFYGLVEQVVAALSRPFPHQDLLDGHALVGEPSALRDSLISKYAQWIDFEQWLLLLAAVSLSFALLFVFGYHVYLCCRCCCSTKPNRKQLTDQQHDACKRNFLNVLLAACVLVNIFAVVALVISAQYAEYGADQLPGRLNLCIDDVNVYKRDTDRRIRKLLIDDYHYLNRSLHSTIDDGGRSVVSRLKKSTGASAIDHFFNISNDAEQILAYLEETRTTMLTLNRNLTKLRNDFSRLRKTSQEDLENCRIEKSAPRMLCDRVQRLLETIDHLPDESTTDMIRALREIAAYNISHIFAESNDKFEQIVNLIQHEINLRRNLMDSKLKVLGDDLFLIAEAMSTQIRQVNLDEAYNAVSRFADSHDFYRQYIRYSWWGSLVLGAVFCLIALCFGLGLLYGCFGSRASPFHDECCVRSTGARLFSCGIGLALLLLVPLFAITAVFMLVGSNLSNIVCHPMNDPLLRPDSITLVERYLEVWRKSRAADELSALLEEPRTGEVLRGCYRNQTLYEIFDLDKKYHLSEMKIYQQEELDNLYRNLDLVFSDIRISQQIGALISPENVHYLDQLKSVNITPISSDYLKLLHENSELLNMRAKLAEVLGEVRRNEAGEQKMLKIVEQVDALDASLGTPIRDQLSSLKARLEQLNSRLGELTTPVPALLLRLQHAQALLAEDMTTHLEQAILDLLRLLKTHVDSYIAHVQNSMSTEVSSCAPLMRIGRAVRQFVCDDTVHPLNGLWMAMLLSLLLTVPIVLFSNCLRPLYEKIHSYPKYIVQEPLADSHTTAFTTDSYDATLRAHKQQPIYSNANSYGSGAYEEFPPPYFGLRTRS